LGITKVGNALNINPCIPSDWAGFKVDYRFGKTHYKINVENPSNVQQGIREVMLDGNPVNDKRILLVDDEHPHEVSVVMG
jgi:cellobiose phosphorylase